MALPDDPAVPPTGGDGIVARMPPDRVFSTYRSKDIFVTETALAYAFAGPIDGLEGFPPHTHDFLEIIVLAAGRGIHHGADGAVPLEPGVVVVVRPGAWHAFSDEHDMVLASIGISPATLGSELAFLRSRESTRDLLYAGPLRGTARGVWVTRISPAAAAGVVEETAQLVRHLEERPDDTLRILGHVLAAIGAITGAMSEEHRPAHPVVGAVLDLLEKSPHRPWTVRELARLVNMGETHLIRVFSADVGVPPIAYLARIRAERAAQLLVGTERTISEIARDVGWADPAYFARRFHALIGLAPTEYRRRMGPSRR